MADSKPKTVPTVVDPAAFIANVAHPTRRADAETLDALFRRISGWEPRMWGPTIIGYGEYHYVYETGHEGDSLATGFSPRKTNQSIYIMPGYQDMTDLLDQLGKYKIGKSCLYINKLADVDLDVLEAMISRGLDIMSSRYEVKPT